MKKAISIILLTVAIIGAAIAFIWGGEISTVRTIESVGGNKYLYRMDYKAAYDLDDLISKDIDTNAELLDYVVGRIGKGLPIKMKSAQVADENGELGAFNCTSFQAAKADGSGYYYGRNYDYYKNPTMVTVSRPKKGYASIAVSDMSHFGYSLEKLPDSFAGKLSCLASIYAPVDGINEKGLCTSIMALPKQAACQESGKHKVGTTIIMRLWLDRCATVQEALDVMHEIEGACGLSFTGIVNNSNLGAETTAQTVLATGGKAQELCRTTGLPLFATTAEKSVAQEGMVPIALQKRPFEA